MRLGDKTFNSIMVRLKQLPPLKLPQGCPLSIPLWFD